MFTPLRAVQINVGRGRQAQALLHVLAERGLDMAVVAEPYWAPQNDPNWAVAPEGSATIHCRNNNASPPCKKIGEGRCFVAVKRGPISVVEVYIRPLVTAIGPCSNLKGSLRGSGALSNRWAPDPLWSPGILTP